MRASLCAIALAAAAAVPSAAARPRAFGVLSALAAHGAAARSRGATYATLAALAPLAAAKLDEDFVSDPKNGFTCTNYPECDECLRQSYDKDEIDPDCVRDWVSSKKSCEGKRDKRRYTIWCNAVQNHHRE